MAKIPKIPKKLANLLRPPKESPPSRSAGAPRKLQKPTYSSFHLHKRIKAEATSLSAFRVFYKAAGTLKRHWKLFLGIVLIYGVLNFVLVQGLKATSDLASLKASLGDVFTGNFAQLGKGVSLFLYLV